MTIAEIEYPTGTTINNFITILCARQFCGLRIRYVNNQSGIKRLRKRFKGSFNIGVTAKNTTGNIRKYITVKYSISSNASQKAAPAEAGTAF